MSGDTDADGTRPDGEPGREANSYSLEHGPASVIQLASPSEGCFSRVYSGSGPSLKASVDFGGASGGLPGLTLKGLSEVVMWGCGDRTRQGP